MVLSVGKDSTPSMQVMLLTVDFKIEEDNKTHEINYEPGKPTLIPVCDKIVGGMGVLAPGEFHLLNLSDGATVIS